MARTVAIAGIDVEFEERGEGAPLLFLHPGEGLQPERPWLDLLARRHRVIAPVHPGFGQSRPPDWLSSVDDLAYLYLDLADRLDLAEATLVGVSFGGWIAAEMTVRNTRRFARLALAAPLGAKFGGKLERDIADMHGITRDEFLALAWADPQRGAVDYAALPDAEVAAVAHARQAFALFGWKPYMHNPHLRHWLHRIDIPTLLLWGEADHVLSPGLRDGWQSAIPGVKIVSIPDAGHFPHWEQPQAFAERLAEFAAARS